TGFAILLGLGVLASLIMMAGLDKTVARAQASQASALDVRAAVRSLRADYLQSADVVSHQLLDPAYPDGASEKRAADHDADRHLDSALVATTRPDLRELLQRLRAQDDTTTNRIQEPLRRLARRQPDKARRVYLAHYLPARARNMRLVDEALRLASTEVQASMRLTEREAADTLFLAWVTLGLFGMVGTTSGLL